MTTTGNYEGEGFETEKDDRQTHKEEEEDKEEPRKKKGGTKRSRVTKM